MEMTRKLFLTGIFSLYPAPGSLAQVVSASFLTLSYLFLQMQASPLKSLADDYLAKVTSFFLVCLFACCVLFRLMTTLEHPQILELLPRRVRSALQLNHLAEVCMMSVAGTVAFTVLIVLIQAHEERRRVQREERASYARRLRYVRNDAEAELGPLTVDANGRGARYHLFLSHCWNTGQDQMRVIKQRLMEMMPEAKMFLECVTAFNLSADRLRSHLVGRLALAAWTTSPKAGAPSLSIPRRRFSSLLRTVTLIAQVSSHRTRH
jgi:hypothetical protein